ncbi:hypothetical protein [Priestia megaterium]|uniref:hypothetical protein n=1 Tax=Priestia megaterium TaxID=1404 RepID=UPI000CA2FA85|nr:hypothetical protein [Priestia megaterium]AUO14801.1 hypothetical protein C0569_26320 [Priestia megaterium]
MIYKLSPILGGRSEVAKLSLMEALGHMCLLKDEEEAKRDEKEIERFINFRSMQFARPVDEKDVDKKRALQEFERQITPRKFRGSAGAGKKIRTLQDYKWDFEKKDE